jgi:hypothetical protein
MRSILGQLEKQSGSSENAEFTLDHQVPFIGPVQNCGAETPRAAGEPGTDDARQAPGMQKPAKQAEIAVSNWKFLPPAGTAAIALEGAAVPTENRGAPDLPKPSSAQPEPMFKGAEESLVRATARAIAEAALVVRQIRNGRVAVVLRPDGETELSLRVLSRNGKVEAFARCDRGDFHLLNARWPELQEYMRQHGINLSDLEQPNEDFLFDREPDRDAPPGRDEFSDEQVRIIEDAGAPTSGRAEQPANHLLELWA